MIERAASGYLKGFFDIAEKYIRKNREKKIHYKKNNNVINIKGRIFDVVEVIYINFTTTYVCLININEKNCLIKRITYPEDIIVLKIENNEIITYEGDFSMEVASIMNLLKDNES